MKACPLRGHDFLEGREHGERRVVLVLSLTILTMCVEIIAGLVFNSMALTADGWHMGTHAAAFGITLFAYRYARRHADNPRFSFGTGKVGVLGGFASAVALGVVALLMAAESVHRLVVPLDIRFNEAIVVAVIGLAVNLVSALLLREGHHHDGEDRAHHHDHNLRAAYFHVLADAFTSVTAIIALVFGQLYGWVVLDPVMGVVGSLIIARWALGLLKDTSGILLDGSVGEPTREAIRTAIKDHASCRITDLHVWAVAPGQLAVILAVQSEAACEPEEIKALLADIPHLLHVNVEVQGGGTVSVP